MLTSLTAPAPRAVALPDEFESVPASAGRFRPDIEGMRGIAVLLVVVFHAGVAQLPGGFVGVDVFFVISGFLITRLLVHEMSSSGWISLRNFYLRRARRLLPALALVTSATVLMAVVVMPPLDAARVGRDGFWSSLYLANVHFMQARLDYFAPTGYESPLLHVWSLAVEEQFYVIWPLLLILAARILNSRAGSAFGLPLVAVTVASFVISLVQSGLDPTTAYFSPFTRAWELGLGGIVAIWWASAPPRAGRLMLTISAVAGMVAIAAGAVLLTEQTLFPGTAALLPVGGAALVLLTAPGTLVGRALSWGPLQAIGGISYSLYLWHWPVLVLGGADGALRSSLLVGEAIGLAWLTHHYFENPIRHSHALMGSVHRGAMLAIACAAIPILLSGAVIASSHAQGRGAAAAAPALEHSSQLSSVLDQALQVRAVPRNLIPAPADLEGDLPLIYRNGCDRAAPTRRSFEQRCTFGPSAAAQKVALLGDSHAGHWFPALHVLARRHDWQLMSLTRDSCPPMLMPSYRRGVRDRACERWRTEALRRVAQEQPDVVVVSGLWQECGSRTTECTRGLSAMLSSIHASVAHARIFVMHDTPLHSADVPTCLSGHLDDVRPCAFRREDVMLDERSARPLRDTVRANHAQLIRADEWLCTARGCPVIVGNVLVYRDGNHLTTHMSRWLAPVMDEALRQAPVRGASARASAAPGREAGDPALAAGCPPPCESAT